MLTMLKPEGRKGKPVVSDGPINLQGQHLPAFSIDPSLLTIVIDPKHPLYDERARAPIDEVMVASIMHYGVGEPVVCRRNGNLIEVIDGRQRVKNAIEAKQQAFRLGQGQPSSA